MTVTGRLARNNIGTMMPVHAEPLTFKTASFRAVDQVSFVYHTDADAAAALLSADLEIDDNRAVVVHFVSYGFSSVGPFRECIHAVQARFRGEDVAYVPHIYITNEQGMLAGREREGLPKLLADIEFDMATINAEGLIASRLSRPASVVLAQGVFRPSELIREVCPDQPVVNKMMGLRVFGSATPDGPLAVCELVMPAIECSGGEIWSGQGSLTFTGASELNPLHRLPIVGQVKAIALRNASFRLRRATETYPLTK